MLSLLYHMTLITGNHILHRRWQDLEVAATRFELVTNSPASGVALQNGRKYGLVLRYVLKVNHKPEVKVT